ncbi:acetate--CoA ligase family protein [Methanopyrus sp.]
MERLFEPRAVAVVGASRDPRKVGHSVLRNLLAGFEGEVYPVNPHADEILGVRCYPSLSEVPGPVDLAVIVVPAPIVPEIVREAGEAGVKYCVVISAGFSEAGNEELERELVRAAREAGVRIVGPNCLGIINARSGLNASFAAEMPPAGSIAFVSQSGALATSVIDWFSSGDVGAIGVGFSKFVSLGNAADLDFPDFLEYLAGDEETDVVVLYLEGVKDGDAFAEALSACAGRKPVIVLKGGRTEAGAEAVSTHTGSLAGSGEVYRGVIEQCGGIFVEGFEEAFDTAKLLAKAGPPRSDRVLVVTNAGGGGILAADALHESGFRLPEPDGDPSVLPEEAATGNPVDVLGDADAERYRVALEEFADPDRYGAVIVILTPQSVTEPARTARVVAEFAEEFPGPVLGVWMGRHSVAVGVRTLEEAGVPTFPSPERAVRALRNAALWAKII